MDWEVTSSWTAVPFVNFAHHFCVVILSFVVNLITFDSKLLDSKLWLSQLAMAPSCYRILAHMRLVMKCSSLLYILPGLLQCQCNGWVLWMPILITWSWPYSTTLKISSDALPSYSHTFFDWNQSRQLYCAWRDRGHRCFCSPCVIPKFSAQGLVPSNPWQAPISQVDEFWLFPGSWSSERIGSAWWAMAVPGLNMDTKS